MSDETYSLKQLVDCLSAWIPEGERPKLMRRVRHWTTHDLLTPLGIKNSGTGNERRYAKVEVYKAAILNDLSNYGMTVHMLEGFGDWLDECVVASPRWAAALTGKSDVYVEVTQQLDGCASFSVYQVGERKPLAFIAPGTETQQKVGSLELAQHTSALTVNITRLFSTLKF